MLSLLFVLFVFFKQKTAYEMRISDWSSDVCSSDLGKGSDLAGAIARHPMHKLGGFFAKPRPFIAAEHVTTDAGTGLVHMAPDHGEEDFIACKKIGIEPVFAVTDDGRYREDWLWLGGRGSVINPQFNAPVRSEEHTSELPPLIL